MSTLTGQSLLQPLQARQRSSASRTASLRQPPLNGFAFDHLEQQAGPTAGGIFFLVRGAEARTHHAAAQLAALAHAHATAVARSKLLVITG